MADFRPSHNRGYQFPRRLLAKGGSGDNIVVNLAPGVHFELLEVRLVLGGSATGNLSVTADHDQGAEHDVTVDTVDVSGANQHRKKYDWKFFGGTGIDFAWTNSGVSWALEVFYRELT